MKLSVVIVCWNGVELIGECLRSIFAATHDIDFEVIVSDNGSTDGSVEFVRSSYPTVLVVENLTNLGCAGGRNAGIRLSSGQYILLLDPDTVVHEGALDILTAFADRHPEAGGFGCRVLNPDGSYEASTQRFPTIWRDWADALGLHRLTSLLGLPRPRKLGKDARERVVDWHSGCSAMFRADLLKSMGGFDEQFFYTYDEVDLCRRLRNSGYPILETTAAVITHLGNQSVNRLPIRFELEKYRNRYRYFYKHFGRKALRQCRNAALTRIRIRLLAYSLLHLVAPSDVLRQKLKICKVVAEWNKKLDPVRFVESGEEPALSTIDWDSRLPNPDLLGGEKSPR